MVHHDLNIAQQAGKRWVDREPQRSKTMPDIKAGKITEVESKERIQKRLDRLAETAAREKSVRTIASQALSDPTISRPISLVETVGLERVIGKSDFLGMDFIELALAIARFVGRINIRNSGGRTVGYGTGFMVSPRLLLTNNHVLSSFEEASNSTVEFDYQVDRFNRLLPVVHFGLDPTAFFLTSTELDYTLVAVQQQSASGARR